MRVLVQLVGAKSLETGVLKVTRLIRENLGGESECPLSGITITKVPVCKIHDPLPTTTSPVELPSGKQIKPRFQVAAMESAEQCEW